jgi:hypothetical protein
MSPMLFKRCRPLLALCTALLLSSCGGGVGQDGTGSSPDTLTTGPINGFGSVIVNGTHFDVSRASIELDGLAGRSQADLRVGMLVAVSGTVSEDGRTGSATRLVYESLLRGTLDELPTGNTLRVLGQQVNVSESTVFAGALSQADLHAGDRLQISGFREADGSLRASWVQRESTVSTLQLTGHLSAVATGSVQVAGLTLDISHAELEGVSAATLAPGQLVRVVLQAAPVAGRASATRLRLIDTRTQDSLIKQQRQGLVAGWNASTSRFTLDGQVVQLSATTTFEDGNLSDIGNGLRVEVKGTLASGVLQAQRLRVLASLPTGYARGVVTSVDLAGNRFTVLGLPGVEVRLRSHTTLIDNETSSGAALALADLRVGNEVFVLGLAGDRRIEANVVTRLPLGPGRGVAGPVRDITGTRFSLLGVSVDTSTASFWDASGAPLSASAFFATLQDGDLIRAEGNFTLGGVQANRVLRVR